VINPAIFIKMYIQEVKRSVYRNYYKVIAVGILYS